MRELVGNVLILQVGVPSAVTNVILAELTKKSLNYDCIEEVLGCIGGFDNLLNEQFVDLASQQQKTIANLVGTPGAILRSVKSIQKTDYEPERMISVCEKNNIRYLFVIGSVRSIEICQKLENAAKDAKYELKLILVPTCDYNSIQLTDHCLGFGSMAKNIAIVTKNVITNIQSQQTDGAVTILEFSDCDDDWILSSSSLARVRKDSSDAPNIVLLSRFDEETFVRNAHALIKDIGSCAVVVGNRLCDANGTQIHAETTAAEHVKMVAESNFDVEVDLVTLSDWKNVPCTVLSQTDVHECELCAQKVLEFSVEMGISGKMMTILRTDAQKYTSEISCVEIGNVSFNKKCLPSEWYSYDEMSLDVPFFKYASPLIAGEVFPQYESGVPVFAKLK